MVQHVASAHANARERPAALRVPSHRGRRRSRTRLPGRPGRRRRRWSSIPTATSPALHDSKMVTALERERLYDVITRKALAWSVASARAGRDRSHQHPPASLRGDAARGHDAGAAAGPRAGRRVSHSGAADGAARRAARRSALHRHRGGVDRRQGDARSRDARRITRPIRATATTGTRAMRPPIISPPSRSTGIRTLHRRSFRPPSLFDTIEIRKVEFSIVNSHSRLSDLWQLIEKRH